MTKYIIKSYIYIYQLQLVFSCFMALVQGKAREAISYLLMKWVSQFGYYVIKNLSFFPAAIIFKWWSEAPKDYLFFFLYWFGKWQCVLHIILSTDAVSLGIVYAHRNEDIVNFGPGIQRKIDINISQNDSLNIPCIPSVQREKFVCKKQKVPLINKRKRTQYSLLARSMGMGELEFSRWLLSATLMDREKVLQDYKRRKKIPKG